MPRNLSSTVDEKIDLGSRFFVLLTDEVGAAQANAILISRRKGATKIRMPNGIFASFCQQVWRVKYTDQRRKIVERAFASMAAKQVDGINKLAMRRGQQGKARRAIVVKPPNCRAYGIGLALLTFFIDVVQQLYCRADTAMLMDHARLLVSRLANSPEVSGEPLPMLEGSAGRSWFYRWRLQYKIVARVAEMKLKVSWAKVKRRTRVLLQNIFRLRALWAKCHPGIEMRWVSYDEKPCYMNNAGLKKALVQKGANPTIRENFAQTRERYSLLTGVQSWPGEPKWGVCFRGAQEGGKILPALKLAFECPEFMYLQVQEKGSYRDTDIAEFLEWALPIADKPEESIVVILDWASSHRSDVVSKLVSEKGHILLFHGGGTTAFTQVNDTHLHAAVSALLVKVENARALRTQQEAAEVGRSMTPNPSRADKCEDLQTIYGMLDHEDIARTGYRQTGPKMPLTGEIMSSDVWKNMMNIIEQLTASDRAGFMNTILRDEAVAHVEKEWAAGRLSGWHNAMDMIIEQDNEDEPFVEGLEGVQYEVVDDDRAASEGEGDGAEDPLIPDEEAGKSDAEFMESDGSGAQPMRAVEDAQPMRAVEGDLAPAEDAPTEEQAAPTEEQAHGAQQLLARYYASKNNDSAHRRICEEMRNTARDRSTEDTKIIKVLREVQHEVDLKKKKARTEVAELARAAADDAQDKHMAALEAKRTIAEAKKEYMLLTIAKHKNDAEQKRIAAFNNAYIKWLYLEFPIDLVQRLAQEYKDLDSTSRSDLKDKVKDALSRKCFARRLDMSDLLLMTWPKETRNKHLHGWRNERSGFRGPVTDFFLVRCSTQFLQTVMIPMARADGKADYGHAAEVLKRILGHFIPCIKEICDQSLVTPLCVLELNDWEMEKSLLWYIIAIENG